MASGKAHTKASLIASVPVFFVDPVSAIGVLSGVFLSPDLDIDNQTVSEKLAKKLIPIAGYLFQNFFYLYALLIPHRNKKNILTGHHSIWSHLPVLGTALRVIYIFFRAGLSLLFSVGVYYLLTKQGYISLELKHIDFPWELFWRWFWGLVISDTLHWFMDLGGK